MTPFPTDPLRSLVVIDRHGIETKLSPAAPAAEGAPREPRVGQLIYLYVESRVPMAGAQLVPLPAIVFAVPRRGRVDGTPVDLVRLGPDGARPFASVPHSPTPMDGCWSYPPAEGTAYEMTDRR